MLMVMRQLTGLSPALKGRCTGSVSTADTFHTMYTIKMNEKHEILNKCANRLRAQVNKRGKIRAGALTCWLKLQKVTSVYRQK